MFDKRERAPFSWEHREGFLGPFPLDDRHPFEHRAEKIGLRGVVVVDRASVEPDNFANPIEGCTVDAVFQDAFLECIHDLPSSFVGRARPAGSCHVSLIAPLIRLFEDHAKRPWSSTPRVKGTEFTPLS
jgi:hypothetical protein